MKKILFVLCTFMCIGFVNAQIMTCYVAVDGTGIGNNWQNAANINNLSYLLNNYYSGEVYVAIAGGEYSNVSVNISGLNSSVTAVHLVGGFERKTFGTSFMIDSDWDTYPTVFHSDSFTPASRVISIDHLSTLSQVPPSSIIGIKVTSDNKPMSENAICLTAGNFVISDCEVFEYLTSNILVMLESASYHAYIINSLIDNNYSSSLLGFYGYCHVINATIADNIFDNFIEGLIYDADLFNSIVWDNSDLNISTTWHNELIVSHSFVQSFESWMYNNYPNKWAYDPIFTYDTSYPYTCDAQSGVIAYGLGSLLTSTTVTLEDFMYAFDIGTHERFYDGSEIYVDAGAYQNYYDDDWSYYNSYGLLSNMRARQKSLPNYNRENDMDVAKTAVTKSLRNGQFIITTPEGKTYNVLGMESGSLTLVGQFSAQ